MEPVATPPPAKRNRVLIVEDHAAIREMLAIFVSSLPEFEVVGQTGSVEKAAQLVGDLRPGLVVLDWMFPDGSSAGFLAQLKTTAPLAQVLVFSATTSAHAVREALTGGAKGFVEKGASMAELTAAIREVAAGHAYFGPVIAQIVDELVRTPLENSVVLSAREREVLGLLAAGLSSKEIAARQNVSLKTVHNYRASIAAKTGLHSIAQLTMHAARLGLIPGPTDVIDPAANVCPAVLHETSV